MGRVAWHSTPRKPDFRFRFAGERMGTIRAGKPNEIPEVHHVLPTVISK